jgi:anti-sigma regulatory factor (Ser/Thr protein kinase)
MSLTLVTDPDSTETPRRARLALTWQLMQWGLERIVDDVALIASELVTNALRHGGGVRCVSLIRSHDHVRLEVSDSNTSPPIARSAGDADTGGRGIAIVALLSERWGVEAQAEGKTVWAQIATSPSG